MWFHPAHLGGPVLDRRHLNISFKDRAVSSLRTYVIVCPAASEPMSFIGTVVSYSQTCVRVCPLASELLML